MFLPDPILVFAESVLLNSGIQSDFTYHGPNTVSIVSPHQSSAVLSYHQMQLTHSHSFTSFCNEA